MFELLWVKLALAFIVGGFWITLTTLIAERWGTKVGGWIGGLPSTVFLSLFFIGSVQSPEIASQATTVTPLVIGFGTLFLLSYEILSLRGHLFGLLLSLLIWFILSGALILFPTENFLYAVLGSFLILAVAYYLVEKKLNVPSKGMIHVRYTPPQILWRALLGGFIITFAALISKWGGPLFGGIFSAFPAMFISTVIITHQSGGLAFSRATAKTLMISGALNPIIYVFAIRYLYLTSPGLIMGTIIAYSLTLLTGYVTYVLASQNLK